MTRIDLNTTPYFDDYSEAKGFYKILFRPGRALQARELTQIQTIIQKQLQRFGSHLFKDRNLVYPSTSMGCVYSTNTVFVKIPKSEESLTHNEASIKNYWLNKEIRTNSLVSGTCIGYSITGEFVRLYIDLKKASSTGTNNNFAGGDQIYVDVTGTNTSGVTTTISTLTAAIESTPNSVGRIACVELPKDSIYFYNGYFVLVDNQFLFIEPNDPEDDSKWNATPTTVVCLEMTESIVTFQDDPSLLDNATGSTNFAAPGGDRLRIEAKLTVRDPGTTDQNIIRLLTIRNGIIREAHQLDTDPYNTPLKDQLAKRTYDESGNYTVRPFLAESVPFLADATNRGTFLEEELSFVYNPDDSSNQVEAYQKASETAKNIFELPLNEDGTSKVVSVTNGGITRYYPGTSYNTASDPTSFTNLCEERIGITLDPGSAYVRGYQQEKNGVTYTSIKKARTSDFIANKTIQTPLGTNIKITNVFGFPTIQPSGSELAYGKINFHRKSRSQNTAPSEVIGTARICSIELFSGTKGQASAVYKLFLFDVVFNDGFDFLDVKSISSSDASIGTFLADVKLRDATVDPSLRFTGLINKRTPFSTSGMTHVSIDSARKIELTLPAGTTTPTLASTAAALTVGSAVSIKTSSTATPQIRLITNVSLDSVQSPTKVTIQLNAPITPTNNTFTTDPSLEVVYKVVGVGTLWKSNPGEKLEEGDMVSIGTGDSKTIYTVFSTPVNDTELNLIAIDGKDPLEGAWSNNSVMNYLIPESISDDTLGGAGLLFRLPHNMIRTIRGGERNSPNSVITANYVARRYEQSVVNASSITFQVKDVTNESFQPGHENYMLVNLSTGTWFELYSAGTTLTSSNQATVTVTDHSVTFNFATSISGNVGAILAVDKSAASANAGTKTLVKGSFDSSDNYTGGGLIVVTNSDNKEVSLKRPDVLRITRIVESPSLSIDPSSKKTNPENSGLTVDGHKIITGAYYLESGQTDYYYGISKIVLRPGFNPPKGQIRVEFDYFTHSTTGDYFSVDSYPWRNTDTTSASMSYDEIPSYDSPNYGTFDLKGCLDFRPVVYDEVGSSSSTQNGNLKFVRFKETPKEGFTCSYHVWESRKDKLYIDTEGLIKIKYGVPGILSEAPAEPSDGMTLYDIELQPYTASHQDCVLKMRDNRRYTMRDIGKLETRIKSLEYYTTLSLLEKDTNDLVIKDALGNDKFKHGFMTDAFENPSVSALDHPDFTAALDFNARELKPRFSERNVEIFEKNSLLSGTARDNARFAANYQKTDTLYTLKYVNTTFLEQPLCSRLINVNPYQTIAFIGTLKIEPWTDSWREKQIAEPLTVYDSGAYDLARKNYGPNGESIIWNGTQQEWSGIEVTQQNKPGPGGEIVVRAGHMWPLNKGQYLDRKGNLINGTGIPKKDQLVQVPPGYANAGEMVPYATAGRVQNIIENTISQTGYEYATGIKNSITDLGWTNPVSLGSKIIEVRAVEFIRANTISFVGKGFMPNSKLYAYFDDVDVTRFCKPDPGYGERIESSYVRGPIANLRIRFTENSIAFQTLAALNAPDSSNKSLSNFGYAEIAAFANDDLSNESILSAPVTITKNAAGDWYVTGTNFDNELIVGSVLVLDGVSTEFEVERMGDADGNNTNTKAKLKKPPTTATEVTSAKSCADKLEALQRLYVSKFVDITGSRDSSRNVTDAKILTVSYKPANNETAGSGLLNEPKMIWTVQTKNRMVATDAVGESDLKIAIKNIASSSNPAPPSELTLTCDSTGTIKGKFFIPDPKVDGNPKFKTGERIFRLTNSPSNENINTVSRSDAKYIARGWLDVEQETLYSTRAFNETSEAVTGERKPITLTDSFETLSRVCPKDPIAQSFIVEDDTGIYITAVDVFFFSKDPNLPVTLQIRPLSDDGEPSTRLLYEQIKDSVDVVVNKVNLAKQEITVLGKTGDVWDDSAAVNTDLNRVTSSNFDKGFRTTRIEHNKPFKYTTVNGQPNPAGDMIPTRFVFDYPVYLPGKNTGFCFVLLTDSTQPAGTGIEALEQTYQVYIAQTGELTSHGEYATPVHRIGALEDGELERNYILGTTQQLTNIPTSNGVLFKSINGWTWESDQRADMKFKIHKAQFDTAIPAQIEFVNQSLFFTRLTLDPFETVAGSDLIRVRHRNHNIPYDTSVSPNKIGKVKFIGLPSTGSLNGIPYQLLMREEGFTIISPTLDDYIIDVGVNASASGRMGGANVFATDSIRYEEFMLIADPIILPDTNISWRISGVTSRAPYDPSQTPYESIPEMNFSARVPTVMPTSAQVCSMLDEVNNLTGAHTSLKITATLTSKDPNVSPVIDSQRLTVVTKGIRLDNPSGLGDDDSNINRNINNPMFDQYVCLPTENVPVVQHKLTGTIDVGAVDLKNKLYFTDTDNKLTGSSFTANQTTITGVGSLFTMELNVGDVIKHPSNNQTRKVVEIQSDTKIIIDDPFSAALQGSSTLLYNPPHLRIKTANSAVAVHLSKLDVGKYLSLEGTESQNRDFTEAKILAVKYTPTATATDSQLSAPCLCEIVVEHFLSSGVAGGFEPGQAPGQNAKTLKLTQLDRFIDEIAPTGGSVASKYVSKIMRINNPANSLRIMFDGCRPEYSHIDLYYKTGSQTDVVGFSNKNWTKAEYCVEENGQVRFVEPGNNPTLESFSEYESNLNQIEPFTIAQIKIVLRGGSAPLYPKIRNLRILALEE